MNEEDSNEINKFYDEEQQKLFGFIRKKGLSSHDAEDVLNDAFLAICAHWSEIRGGSPRGYLYRAAQNEIYRRWRSRSRGTGELGDLAAALTEDLAQQVADQETLRLALVLLTERERQAVLLRYYAGFDVAETALIMGGITPGAVKRYAFDGRSKLKRALISGTGSDTRKEVTR